MDNDELKEALFKKTPVIFTHPDGHKGEYKYVSAIIYRNAGGKLEITAEISDYNGRTVVICDPQNIRQKE